jgi:hypothetical protein
VDHESFYSTTAEVIPVLWIVLVFQLRFFGTKAEESGVREVGADDRHKSADTLSLVVIVAVGFGLWLSEAFAIAALAEAEDSAFMRLWIKTAITAGGFLVFFVPVFPWFEALMERVPLLKAARRRWFDWLEKRRKDD